MPTDWTFDPSRYEGHTPGPWSADASPHFWIGRDGSFSVGKKAGGEATVLASRSPFPGRANEMRANAKLIADAPHLLREVERLRAENRSLRRAARGGNALSSTADMLDFLAHRIKDVYNEPPNRDYLRCAHERASMLRASLAQGGSDGE